MLSALFKRGQVCKKPFLHVQENLSQFKRAFSTIPKPLVSKIYEPKEQSFIKSLYEKKAAPSSNQINSFKKPIYQKSRLSSGPLLMTESEISPSYQAVALTFGCGTQHQAPEEQGLVFLIKEYLRSALMQKVPDLYIAIDNEQFLIRLVSAREDMDAHLQELFDALGQIAQPSEESLAAIREARNLEFELQTIFEVAGDFAFKNSPLGQTTSNPKLNENIDFDLITKRYTDFYRKFFVPENINIVVCNSSNHETTAAALDKIITSSNYGDLMKNRPAFERNSLEVPPSTFKPGVKISKDLSLEDMGSEEEVVDFYLMWHIPGWSDKKHMVFFMLSWLLGNASGFMEGGPGRGMHCRAVYNINKHYGLEEINTILKMHKDTGCFGIHVKCLASQIDNLLMWTLYDFFNMPQTLTQEELDRARILRV